ncbi:RES family NAD+ phosphorylase [Pseudomonas guariconensis]|uniref:RES family NAD+ phosphorylase n=1 Tax=Pseudomonas guariconensis TaxID=1288410 RepID=UPI002D1EE13C|nr:RES family NAD+ phosphorylase [Pseudomonas guariconensis]MEB3843077.1 RES family NAD+ phosphorylase [Pseudomonas guariconensis]MEB3875945.1 RES family NAD+ phosphorylase [Pseudomonas guariconensis]MEB3880772.1 RES family NAD+ phosphorylase [Pseudomonas guariconensis]MEB3897908.1 RES family NAD+ phosphorylase [Pseudomonas guariconensis]
MPMCCAFCFQDKQLTSEIKARSKETGNCYFCNTQNTELIDPIELREFFELLQGLYINTETNGRSLADWFKTDWKIFDNLTSLQAKELLGEIYDDANLLRKSFTPITNSTPQNLDIWTRLRAELMEENRFFPKDTISRDRIRYLAEQLILENESLPPIWYRARIQDSDIPYPIEKMGAPPKDKASHGRANPVGISYLYMASELNTAISEIRPHTGERITIAEFEITERVKLADLRDPRKLVTPFICDSESQLIELRGDIAFLERLGEELARPVLPRSAAIDYIPSQYLCELIKNIGFDGVIYKSSIGSEINVALFYPQKAQAKKTSMHYVSRVKVEANIVE